MKLIRTNQKNLKKIVEEAVKSIEQGQTIVCPTDTVYGLLTDATNEKAVKKLFKIKKRAKEKAIPIFIRDLKMAKKLAKVNKRQEKLLKSVWFTRPNFWVKTQNQEKLVEIAPKIWAVKGKVTAVLKRKKIKLYGVDKKTIALRIPDYKLVNILLKKLNRPLTGTSANISGKPASTKIKEILKQFKNQKLQPDLVIDTGNLKKSKPSTIIDFTKKRLKILRKGPVKLNVLQKKIGN